MTSVFARKPTTKGLANGGQLRCRGIHRLASYCHTDASAATQAWNSVMNGPCGWCNACGASLGLDASILTRTQCTLEAAAFHLAVEIRCVADQAAGPARALPDPERTLWGFKLCDGVVEPTESAQDADEAKDEVMTCQPPCSTNRM